MKSRNIIRFEASLGFELNSQLAFTIGGLIICFIDKQMKLAKLKCQNLDIQNYWNMNIKFSHLNISLRVERKKLTHMSHFVQFLAFFLNEENQ